MSNPSCFLFTWQGELPRLDVAERINPTSSFPLHQAPRPTRVGRIETRITACSLWGYTLYSFLLPVWYSLKGDKPPLVSVQTVTCFSFLNSLWDWLNKPSSCKCCLLIESQTILYCTTISYYTGIPYHKWKEVGCKTFVFKSMHKDIYNMYCRNQTRAWSGIRLGRYLCSGRERRRNEEMVPDLTNKPQDVGVVDGKAHINPECPTWLISGLG